jgi:hypothetical protein
MDHPVTEQEIYEAALQYVRKVSGYRKPSKANEEAFNKAIEEVAESTRKILANLKTVEDFVLSSSKSRRSKVAP